MSLFLRTKLVFCLLAGCLAAGALFAQVPPVVPNGSTVPNWAVPPYHQTSAEGGLSTMSDISNGTTFVAMTPCRVFDTRNPVGPYGGPRLIANVTRNFDIDSGPCAGIPSASAYSMSFGAILADGDGFITFWPAGSAQPTVSSINTLAGRVIANSAIVPAGSGGAISVFPNTGVDLYGDINGYFTSIYNNGNALVQVGNIPGAGIGIFANAATANNSAGVLGIVGPGFSNTVCCGPGGVIGKGAFNGVAGVAQNRATVGVLVTPAGGVFAEGQLGVSGASATQAYGVNGFTHPNATADDTAGVLGNALGSSGRIYGGRFFTQSSNAGAAGVIGFSADAAFAGINQGGYAGVIGIASVGEGVKGIVSNGSGEGTTGFMTDGAGTFQTEGALGYTSTTAVEGFGNIVKTGSVAFAEPHPTDATKMVKYVSLEGNEAGTYFRGRGKFQNGIATIDVPDDFRIVTQPEGLSIQVTPIGDMASVAVALISLDRIVVKGSRNVEFFYTVNGIRRGYGDFTSIVETDKTYIPKSADAQMPQVWNGEIRNRLIANGTYKADGTVNMETAQRLGWDRVWAERERARPAPQAPPQ